MRWKSKLMGCLHSTATSSKFSLADITGITSCKILPLKSVLELPPKQTNRSRVQKNKQVILLQISVYGAYHNQSTQLKRKQKQFHRGDLIIQHQLNFTCLASSGQSNYRAVTPRLSPDVSCPFVLACPENSLFTPATNPMLRIKEN
jgi:hypothetical protein